MRCIVLAHLSRVNNVPEIAEMSCREALTACGRDDVEVVVARQDRVAPTVDLQALVALDADLQPVVAHGRHRHPQRGQSYRPTPPGRSTGGNLTQPRLPFDLTPTSTGTSPGTVHAQTS